MLRTANWPEAFAEFDLLPRRSAQAIAKQEKVSRLISWVRLPLRVAATRSSAPIDRSHQKTGAGCLFFPLRHPKSETSMQETWRDQRRRAATAHSDIAWGRGADPNQP